MYPDLYRIIGITYGPGDSSTTFNLPNLLGRFIEGSSTSGLVKEAGLPNIEGETCIGSTTIGFFRRNNSSATGAFAKGTTRSQGITGGTETTNDLIFDASLSNAIYGNSDTVQPPSVTVRYIIKAFNAATPESSLVDMTQYANDLANRLTREMTPAFNKRVKITTSGTFTAPVSGWYKFTIKGAGGGGGWGTNNSYAGAGGSEGGTTFAYEKMLVGETATITIGAGGSGSNTSAYGGNGGDSSVNVNNNIYVAGGGGGGITHGGATPSGLEILGGSGDIYGSPGCGAAVVGSYVFGGSGGGKGAGFWGRATASGYGAGGAGGTPSFSKPSGNGSNGVCVIEYLDPTIQ